MYVADRQAAQLSMWSSKHHSVYEDVKLKKTQNNIIYISLI